MKDSDQRFTPEHILDVIRAFDAIGLDPCTTLDNRTGARVFCAAPHSDGLELEWLPEHGLVWVNHPYSVGQSAKWAAKMHFSARRGCEVISLGAADTSTGANRFLLHNANAVAFWSKRISFIKPDGTYEQGAKFANASFYFGDRVGRFRRVFEPHATVINLQAGVHG